MVLKTLFASAIEEEEEEDVYLRKCNIRKSKRQNEKSRKIALQTNEALSLERVPSPLPLSTIRSGSVGKSPARKEKPYTSPYFPPKSRTNSTDDVYPQPSPPPRSPSFSSPVALGRTLALSLSLFSPGGFTISASNGGGANAYSGRKSQSHNALSSMRSPEYVGIQKAHSTDSNGSWGEIVEIGSPHSPHSPHRSPNQSPNSDHKRISNTASTCSPNHPASGGSAANKTPLREEYYHDGEHNAHLRDSNRVKQFLFHRDRNRARKAQLLYPSGTYGNSCEFSPDLDEHRYNNIANSPDTKNRADRKIGSPGSKNRRSGSFGNSGGSGKHARKYSDERNIKVDVDIDTRSGSVGNASMLSPHGVRRASFRVDSPTTPYASGASASASGGTSDEHNSPYYRALTLGARTSLVHAGLPMRKDVRSASVSSVGSAGSSADSVVSTSPTTSSTAVHAIAYEDTYVRRRRDSITCDSPVNSHERSAEIYETLFPALPVGLVKTTSNLGSVVDSVLSSAVIKEMDGVCGASVRDTELYVPKVVVPTVPVYSTEQVCSMFYTAVVHAGLVANNMPTDTATNTATISAANATTHTDTDTNTSANTTRYRAWDDADSSDDESTSDNSFMSDSTNTTSTSVAAIHQQVQKLTEIDATCGSLIQKCDYIYDTIKTKVPYKFDREYVNMIVVPFVVSHHTTTSADAPSTSTTNSSPVLSIAELFTHYVQSRLVYQLVQLLQYEDTRFESNRLPLLYVLYKGSCTTSVSSTTTSSVSVRTKIAQAIEHTTSERVSRCRQLLRSATASEMDVNFISKSGFSELVANCPINTTSTSSTTKNMLLPLTAVATSCDITAIIQSENERSTYKTKDSEVTIIELMKFIISHEIGELLVSDSNTSNSGSGSRGSVAQRNSESRAVLMCIVRAYCSLFRCYTHKLGAHYAGGSDSVEQPVLLEYLTQLLDGILAWAKVLYNGEASTTDTVMYGGSANNSPDRSSSKRKHRSAVTTPTSTSTANNSNSTESVLEEVCECILHSTYKHWTNKLNYAQDVAYLLQCEVILTMYTPTTSTSTTTNTGLLYSAVFASTNRSDNTKKAVLPPLLPHPTATTSTTTNACVVQKILYKMLTRVCSQHVKVATQAMQSIQSPILMVRYFLPRMTTAMVSYIFGTEVGRTTFMSGPGWENSRREECLNLLVDKLRDCRNVYLNFSTQLQISSTQLLDTTLELLQVIEDAE